MRYNQVVLILLFICGTNTFQTTTFAQTPLVQWEQTKGPHGSSFFGLAADPFTGNVWATAGHKLYVSSDHGDSWRYMGLPEFSTKAFGFRSDGAIFAGAFVSYDQGSSWKKTTMPDSVYVRALAVDEASSYVFAATDFGLYYTADDGDTWIVADSRNVDGVWNAGNGYVFARTRIKPQKLLRSSDGGLTWVEDPFQVNDNELGFLHGPDSLSYLLSFDNVDREISLYRSDDYGDSWEFLITKRCAGTDLLGFTPEGELITASRKSGISRLSADFQRCETIFDDTERRYAFVGSSSPLEASILDREGVLFVSSGFEELLRSEDAGQTWQLLEGKGIIGTSVYSMYVEPQSGKIFSGTRSKGLFRSGGEDQQWTYEGFSSETINGISSGKGSGELWLSTSYQGLFRSIDSGVTWSHEETEVPEWISSLQFDSGTETLYVMAIGDIYYSQDGGEMWNPMNAPYKSAIDPPITGMTTGPNGDVYALIRDDIFARSHGVYRTADLGVTWEKIDNSFPEFPSGGNIMFFDSSGQLWVNNDNTLFVSHDEGVTWEERATGKSVWINVMHETPDGSLWIGHGTGLLRSIDGGQTWREEHENLDHLCVLSLAWNEQESELLVGTHRGGVYRGYIDLSIRVDSEDMVELPSENQVDLINYPNPAVSSTTISFHVSFDGPVRMTLYDPLGRRLSKLLDQHVTRGTHEVMVNMDSLPPGLYLYRLETPFGAHSNSIIRIE